MHSVESAHYSLTTLKSRTQTLMSSQYTTSHSAPVSKARLQELRLVTQSDPTLCSLAKAVHEGWLQSKKDCPKQLLRLLEFQTGNQQRGWSSLQEPKTSSATQ